MFVSMLCCFSRWTIGVEMCCVHFVCVSQQSASAILNMFVFMGQPAVHEHCVKQKEGDSRHGVQMAKYKVQS